MYVCEVTYHILIYLTKNFKIANDFLSDIQKLGDIPFKGWIEFSKSISLVAQAWSGSSAVAASLDLNQKGYDTTPVSCETLLSSRVGIHLFLACELNCYEKNLKNCQDRLIYNISLHEVSLSATPKIYNKNNNFDYYIY